MSNNEKLAIIITERNAFGYLFVPYIIDSSSLPTIKLIEQISPTYIQNNKSSFNQSVIKLLNLLVELSEPKMFKRFSKQKTLKSFYEKLTQETLDKFISPFIDKIHCDAIKLIIDNDIPIYLKDGGYSNLYESDKIILNKYASRPRFFFTLTTNNELSYKLKIVDNNSEHNLFGKKIIELSADPAVLLFDHKIFHFDNIDCKKFRPFYQKYRIIVPTSSIDKYMNSFVRACISQYYVSAYGFNIVKSNITCKPILNIENTPLGYKFVLRFKYGDDLYNFNQMTKIVKLNKENGQYTFETCNRQISAEQTTIKQLAEIGLTKTDSAILNCDSINTNNVIYPFIEWINNNYKYLNECGIETNIIDTNNYYKGSVELRMNIDNQLDWFDIYGTVVLDGFEIPFIKLRDNIIDKCPEYILPNGKIFIIPTEWFATWNDIFAFSKIKNDKIQLGHMHSTLLPAGMCDIDNEYTQLTPSTTPRQGKLNAQLRPYQEQGFVWMNTLFENNRGGILADDMGLGKTIQTIALLSHIYANNQQITCNNTNKTLFNDFGNTTNLPATLIVMPVSLIFNWINEIKRFAPHLFVYNYNSHNRLKDNEISQILNKYHIVVTSYGIIRNECESFAKCQFYYLILDESQYVKNYNSKTYHAIKQIQAQHTLTISGTPIENRLSDLWAQMNIVNPGLLGNATFFHNYFEIPITKVHNEERENKLKIITAPYILRRTKEMVIKDLPPITYQTINCLMTDEQREVYEREKSSCRNEILNITESNINKSFFALQAITRLRLIANHPILIDKDYTGTSGKFVQIIDQINNIAAEGHKMLIFSAFVRDLDLLSKTLTESNIEFSMLTGNTINRKKVIEEFSSSTKKVFLISLKAGGVGLNLTCADYVFVLNPWWNPAVENQAISRAHRIGQTKKVFVYRFITNDTIEEKILKLQEQKLAIASNFVRNNNPITDLSNEEIKDLFV